VPLVDPERGASLLGCKDALCSSLKRRRRETNTIENKFGTQRHMNKACNIYLLTYEF
jgi:hypothetical protein